MLWDIDQLKFHKILFSLVWFALVWIILLQLIEIVCMNSFVNYRSSSSVTIELMSESILSRIEKWILFIIDLIDLIFRGWVNIFDCKQMIEDGKSSALSIEFWVLSGAYWMLTLHFEALSIDYLMSTAECSRLNDESRVSFPLLWILILDWWLLNIQWWMFSDEDSFSQWVDRNLRGFKIWEEFSRTLKRHSPRNAPLVILSFTDFTVYRVTWLAPSLAHSSHEHRPGVMTLIIAFFLKNLRSVRIESKVSAQRRSKTAIIHSSPSLCGIVGHSMKKKENIGCPTPGVA
jgi:hypothetical protein